VRSAVACVGEGAEFAFGISTDAGAFREVLPQQALGVFISSTLPRVARVAKADCQTRVDLALRMLGHFCALIPS